MSVTIDGIRPTAMGSQKYKNETQKFVVFLRQLFLISFFVCSPLWAGRIKKKQNKNETEVASVEYWPSKSLLFENEAGHYIIG